MVKVNDMTPNDNAMAKIETHEAVCEERYGQINARLKRLEMVVMTTAGTIIILLLNLVLKVK
jgi:predicted nucleic acid-binding Zn ribbon protein